MTMQPRRPPGRKICMVGYGESNTTLPPMFNEALSLARAGFDVESLAVALTPAAKRVEEYAPGFSTRRFRIRTRTLSRALFGEAPARGIAALQRLVSYAEFVLKAFALAFRSRADVYEAHDLPALLPTVLAARLRGRPIVYRAHELYSETHAIVRFARFWRSLDRILVPRCDEVVTPEEHRSRIYHEEFGARRPPLTVLNCPPYRPPIESTKLRDELAGRGVPASTIVLYQGLVDSMRCIEEIAEASRRFDEGIVLVILGGGFGAWSDPAARLAGNERIVVLPRVPYDEVAPYTASADVGVLLYRNDCRNNYYCAPNKLFEYMMMGVPVLAPRFPGMTRLVEGSDVGMCVDPADPREIADAVNALARDAGARRRMRANGLRLSKERYNWGQEFVPLLQRYRALLGGRGAAARTAAAPGTDG